MARIPARRSLVVVAVFAVVAAFGAGAGSLAFRKPPTPLIATVNLEGVFNGLDERKAKEVEFEAKRQEFKAKLDELEKQITDDTKKYDTMPAGPQKKLLGQSLVRNSFQYRSDKEYAEQFLDLMYGEMLRELYDKIAVASRELATKNGYTMVVADDSPVQIRSGGRADVNRMISLKRSLFTHPDHDVTQELILMMNNQFANP